MIVLALLSHILAQFIEPKLRIPIFSILAFALYVVSGGVILGIILYFAGALVIPNMMSAIRWNTLPYCLKKVETGYIVNQNTINRRTYE